MYRDVVGVYVGRTGIREKGLLEIWDYADWWLTQLGRLPFIRCEHKTRGVRHFVTLPKTRYHRRSYYRWLLDVEVPKRNWVLITLTLERSIPLFVAWLLIGMFISLFLNRMRNYFRKRGSGPIGYIWVLEPHKDGFPHAHILISFPFVKLERIISWWKDKAGNPLSQPQGVDVKFIGRNTQLIKAYLMKYLVKSHKNLYTFRTIDELKKDTIGFRVLVRLSTLLIWYYGVRLFGTSRGLFRKALQESDYIYVLLGFKKLTEIYERFYEPHKIPFSEFILSIYYGETLDWDRLLSRTVYEDAIDF